MAVFHAERGPVNVNYVWTGPGQGHCEHSNLI